MKGYMKIGLTAMLLTALVLLSGFRAQTIIHDDGSETQDVLKVSDSKSGQKKLTADAEEFQKRNYTVMDYSNSNGEGFRAMRTITKEGANKSSIDHIVHKTHDGFICSTYYIDYKYTPDSIQSLRLGVPMEEDGLDLEYIISFPSGTRVTSNSTKSDDQGSTYQWNLANSSPKQVKMQATVWHKLAIYFALAVIFAIVVLVLIMEHRRRNVISWKKAAHMRRVEMMLLFLPIFILGYMGYEYYVGTHVTADTLAKVSQQQQEELLQTREEDKRLQDSKKQRDGDMALAKYRTKAAEISNALRSLNRGYTAGQYSQSSAKAEARRLASQAKEMLNNDSSLSQADREVLRGLVDTIVSEADSIGTSPASTQRQPQRIVPEEPVAAPSNTTAQDNSSTASGSSDTNTGSSDSTASSGSSSSGGSSVDSVTVGRSGGSSSQTTGKGDKGK